jgi:hypothetical protein
MSDSKQRDAIRRTMARTTPSKGVPEKIGRDGAPKHIVDAPITPGMVRQTQGMPAAYHHGVTVDDEPNSDIVKSFEKPIGFHSGVSDAQIMKSSHGATANQVLTDAANLGRPVDKDKPGGSR